MLDRLKETEHEKENRKARLLKAVANAQHVMKVSDSMQVDQDDGG
jgi:hypothetical protein